MLYTYQLINSACCLRWYKDNTQLLDVTEYVLKNSTWEQAEL